MAWRDRTLDDSACSRPLPPPPSPFLVPILEGGRMLCHGRSTRLRLAPGVTLALEGTILQHLITRVAWILGRSHPSSRVFYSFFPCLSLPAGEVARDHAHD